MNEEIEYKTCNLNLRRDQVKYLKTLPNASEFVRNAIDKAVSKKVGKKKPKSQIKKKFTVVEEQIIEWLIKREDDSHDSIVKAGYDEFDKPYRYRTKPNVSWPIKKWRLLDLLKEDNKTKEYKFIKKSSDKTIEKLFEEASRQWISKYPENWKVQITPKWTLGDLMFELHRRRLTEVTVHEVAAIMGVNYYCVYNKVRPLLMAEDIDFVRKPMRLAQYFTLENLEGYTAKNFDKMLNKAIWELHCKKLNSTQISKQLGVYPAFIRKRIGRLEKEHLTN